MMCSQNVELGFVEKTESWRLSSHFFPSKVGGRPAWLALSGLPHVDDVRCPKCNKPCIFLLQIYSPLPDIKCFHRTLFVFCCRNPSCHTKSDEPSKVPFLVFRNQIPKCNEFYSSEPPDEENIPDGSEPKLDSFGTTSCEVCNCLALNKCSKCKLSAYCSKPHQVIHWKHGHREECGKEGLSKKLNIFDKVLFPEYALVMETEEYEEKQPSKSDMERMSDYSKYTTGDSGNSAEAMALNEEELQNMAYEDDDKQFRKFKERTSADPEQVIRYHRGKPPLWVSSEGKARDVDIPKCCCGADRQFEFQILPQLLIHMDVDDVKDSIDWGTLLIYTCSQSCKEGHCYKTEFLWKQNFSSMHPSQS